MVPNPKRRIIQIIRHLRFSANTGTKTDSRFYLGRQHNLLRFYHDSVF